MTKAIDKETEFVARAIVRGIGLNPDGIADGEPQWRMYIRDARAAIEAVDDYRARRVHLKVIETEPRQ